jgi:hypothetical protein
MVNIILSIFPYRGFSKIIFMTYWFLIKLFLDYVFGTPKGSINIGSYIYHGVSSYFFLLGFEEFCLIYRYTLVFFPQGFSKLRDHDWWTNNDAYKEPIDQEGVLRIIISDQFIVNHVITVANDGYRIDIERHLLGIERHLFTDRQLPIRLVYIYTTLFIRKYTSVTFHSSFFIQHFSQTIWGWNVVSWS